MKNKTLLILALAAALIGFGCTENQRARSFGGNATIDLPKGQKVVNVAFKEDNLWVLTRTAKVGEQPEEFKMIEESSFGLLSGTVTIKEH